MLFSTAQADSFPRPTSQWSNSEYNYRGAPATNLQKKPQASFCQRMVVMLAAESKLERFRPYKAWGAPESCNQILPSATKIKKVMRHI